MQSHGLRIKDVVHEDAGDYTCKATNGFGSVSVGFTLHVLGRCHFKFVPKPVLIVHTVNCILLNQLVFKMGRTAPRG